MLVEASSVFVHNDEIGGNAAQPVGQFFLNNGELAEAEVSPISQDGIPFPDGIHKIFAEISVLLSGSVESAGHCSSIDEIDLNSRGDAVAVAMGGEKFVVALWQFLLGGIYDENVFEVTLELGDFNRTKTQFFKQAKSEGIEHEGDGKTNKALPECLLGEGKWLAVFQGHCELIERSLTGEDRIKQGEEISGCAKSPRVPDNQFGFSCDAVESGEKGFRTFGS